MSFWVLCLLCIIQGLTEFLPVSSSGHLLLIEQLFGVGGSTLMLNLFLHLATLLAVIIVYRKLILSLLKHPLQPLTYKLFLSTVLTVIIAVIYEVLDLEQYGFKIYGFCFLATAILLLVTFIFQRKSSAVNTGEVSVKSAIAVGIVQGFAVLPGLSRSGSTISTMILMGNDEEKASQYSFLLSIPVILGGFVLELIKLIKNGGEQNAFATINPWLYLFAFVLTFAVAMLSLKLTLKLLKKHKFVYFAIYLFVLATAVIVINFFI